MKVKQSYLECLNVKIQLSEALGNLHNQDEYFELKM